MSFINKLKEHKHTNVSINILIGISVFILINSVLPFLRNLDQFNYDFLISFISTILITLVVIAPAFIFELKKRSFASHLILFAFYLNEYIIKIFDTSQRYQTIDALILFFGLAASIYTLLKMYAHKEEITDFTRVNNRNVDIIVIISLIKVFLDSKSFASMSVYLIIYIVILMSMKKIDTLILSLSIYSKSLINNVYFLFSNATSQSSLYVNTIFSIILNLVIIYFIYITYKREDNYYH